MKPNQKIAYLDSQLERTDLTSAETGAIAAEIGRQRDRQRARNARRSLNRKGANARTAELRDAAYAKKKALRGQKAVAQGDHAAC